MYFHLVEGTCEDEFNLLSFIWRYFIMKAEDPSAAGSDGDSSDSSQDSEEAIRVTAIRVTESDSHEPPPSAVP
jgi:hypothetical protein